MNFSEMARDFYCPQNRWELTQPSNEVRKKAKKKKKGRKK
jgi:hypothetical protein